MTREEIRENREGEGLFIEAHDLLSGALDLIHQYAENSNSKDDGTNMYKVYAILKESLKRFDEYDEKIYG